MKKYLTLLITILASNALIAQTSAVTTTADSLLNTMDNSDKKAPVVIFKSSRMVLNQSTEMIKKKNLNFLIIHRFGDFAGKLGGGRTYFGLDNVNDVYIGFEYGVSDNFNIGIGRSTIYGLADLQLKYAVVHQKADNSSPIAITALSEFGVRPYGFYNYGAVINRFSYLGQLIFARKFSSYLSLSLAPTYVRNNVPIPVATNNTKQFFALTGTARIGISKRAGIIIDYGKNFSTFARNSADWSDPLGIGLEIETGGHVFTVNVTNARAVNEINYLSDGTGTAFGNGAYRLGFTISRMFDFNGRKKKDKQ